MDPHSVLEHCTWLTLARVERLRFEWRLHARVRDDRAIYVQINGDWALLAPIAFGAGIELGIETIIRMRGGVLNGPPN